MHLICFQPNRRRVLDERLIRGKHELFEQYVCGAGYLNGIKYKFQAGVDIGSNNLRDFAPSTAGGAFIAPSEGNG